MNLHLYDRGRDLVKHGMIRMALTKQKSIQKAVQMSRRQLIMLYMLLWLVSNSSLKAGQFPAAPDDTPTTAGLDAGINDIVMTFICIQLLQFRPSA